MFKKILKKLFQNPKSNLENSNLETWEKKAISLNALDKEEKKRSQVPFKF